MKNSNKGYTLVEVLTIAGVGALLIVALTALVGRSIHITRDQSQQVQTTEEARRELERTSNTIRSSQDVTVNNQIKNWLESGDNFSITLYSNVDGDPAVEKVRYFVDASDPTAIQKGITQADSNGGYTNPEELTVLTRSLRNQAPTQALFYYKDKEGNVLNTPLTNEDLTKVVTVGLAWRIDADPNTDPAPQDIGTEVTPRHNTVVVATPPPILLPPTDFDCEALSSTSISCSWTDPNPASPGAPEEDGFKYYDVTAGVVIDDTIAANTTTYVENGLTPSTDYTRDVTTFNADGETAHSNLDTVTTLPNELDPPTLGPCSAADTTISCGGTDGPPVAPGDPTPTPIIDVYEGVPPTPTPVVPGGPTPVPGPTTTPIITDVPLDINGNYNFIWPNRLKGRTYDIYTKARKGAEQSDPSNVVSVDTPCTIGGLVQVNPSPTPSPTPYPPNISPAPTPRFTAGTAPCFTIGFSVPYVYRVDPITQAFTDASAGYTWWIYPEGQPNQRVNGGTPGPFYEFQVIQGTKYVVGITHNVPGPLNGLDECTYLTSDPQGNSPTPGNIPSPILVAPGNGQTNYKLIFYYMPIERPGFMNPDRNFVCKIFEARGGQVRPTQNIIRVHRVFVRDANTGVVTDHANTTRAAWQTVDTSSGQRSGGFDNRTYLTLSDGAYMIDFYTYMQDYKFERQLSRLTEGIKGLGLPLTSPWPHFTVDLDYWTDEYWRYGTADNLSWYDLYLNSTLIEHWTGQVLRPQQPLKQPRVGVRSLSINGEDWTFYYQWFVSSSPTVNGPVYNWIRNQYASAFWATSYGHGRLGTSFVVPEDDIYFFTVMPPDWQAWMTLGGSMYYDQATASTFPTCTTSYSGPRSADLLLDVKITTTRTPGTVRTGYWTGGWGVPRTWVPIDFRTGGWGTVTSCSYN